MIRTLLLAAAVGLSFALPAHAADWPTKPVRIIVPYAPGGSGDNAARPYAEALSHEFGQQFVIDNRGGAGGAIGTETVAKSANDGYTLLMCPMGALVILPHTRKVPYDPIKDFAPISRTAETLAGMVVHPSLGVKTVQEFVALAKKKPGDIYFGSAGLGTITQMRGEILKDIAGIDIVHVPYKGSAEALNDLLAGHVQAMFEGNVLPQAKAGKLNLLAVVGDERHPDFPDVPIMKEAGFPTYEAPSWHGFLAPAGTPPEIVERLSAAVIKISKTPQMRETLIRVGLIPAADTPKGMAEIMQRHSALFASLVQRLDIKNE
jgi:tripartite-type tricarboxylate transporter receptor subunit TctC